MHLGWSTAVVAALVALGACGTSDGSGGQAGAGGVEDSGAPDSSGMAGADAGDDSSTDGRSIDVETTELGPVQCRATVDCPGPATAGGCFATKPGGVCTRCDIRMVCPSGTECVPSVTDTMECARTCAGDADCNRGMFCNDTMHCEQRRCDVLACPEPYTCDTDSHLCVRPKCSDAMPCPAPLICSPINGVLCVEP